MRVFTHLSALLLFLLMTFDVGYAHEMRPAYLELTETQSHTFHLLWKVPAIGDRKLALHVQLPETCKPISPPTALKGNAAFIEEMDLLCAGGLEGKPIEIAGLQGTFTDVLVRVHREEVGVTLTRLTPANPSFVVQPAPSPFQLIWTYLMQGVEHILGGIDHLLFVLALLILVGGEQSRTINGRRRLVGTITAFTLAHSVTLAAATLGFVQIPQPPVEAVIALSIIFVAREIIRSRQGSPSLTEKYPWGVALAFGLLHGFGFAGALAEVGLPQSDIPLALFFFNVGVEIGQLVFVACILSVLLVLRRFQIRGPKWSWRLAPYAIGSLAGFWVIDRVTKF